MLWMAEMLNLCLREFSDADEAGSRRDFISVRLPNLSSGKGKLAAIVVQKIPAGHNSP